jgi:hypothetical protein
MARIRSIASVAGSSKIHPTEVEAEVSVVQTSNSQKFFQISTFGSDQRKSQPKVSQTIQFDEKRARELVRLINEAFGIKGN